MTDFRQENTLSSHKFRGKPGTSLAIMPVQDSMNSRTISLDTRKKSILATIIDVVFGYVIFLPVNYFVLPLLAGPIAEYNILTAIQIGIMFSTISLIRKFALRRWFERMRNCESIVN